MATLISLDDQRIWAPPKHNFTQESFSEPSSCKQQKLPLQDRTATSPPAEGFVLPGSSSNDAIIISSDEEDDTDNEDDGVNDPLQSSQPRKSHSSVAGNDAASDASGEWDESYCGTIDETRPQLPGTVYDHTVTSLPAAERDSVRIEVISPAPSGSVAHDSMEPPFSQFVSVPETSG